MHGTGQGHRFLFLQGPHGPFFHRLGKMLTAAGAQVWRVGFNRGDRAFWPTTASYIPFKGTPDLWPASFAHIVAQHAITDLVLYGDTRPIHAQAIANRSTIANAFGSIRRHAQAVHTHGSHGFRLVPIRGSLTNRAP